MDLLRVISHHRARLATPIRTIQKVYTDADVDSVPFGGGVSSRRPFLLIEPPHKINGDDKIKSQSGSDSSKSEAKVVGTTNQQTKSKQPSAADTKTNVKNNEVPNPSSKVDAGAAAGEKSDTKTSSKPVPKADSKTDQLKGELTQKPSDDKIPFKTISESSELNGGAKAAANPTVTASKQETERGSGGTSPSTSRPALEDNIVLGVALEGSKRTLPIEDEVITTPPVEAKELTSSRTGNGSSSSEKDKASE